MLKTRAGEIVGDVPATRFVPPQHPRAPPSGLRILRRKAVTEKTGLERSAIYDGMAKGTFPKQVRLSSMAVGWIEEEIDLWIAERIRRRDEQAVEASNQI